MVLLDPLSLPTPLSLLMITSRRHGHGLQLLHLGLCPVLPSQMHLKHLRFTLKQVTFLSAVAVEVLWLR